MISGCQFHKHFLVKLATVSFTDLDQGSEMIIFQSVLSSFEASSIFEASGAVATIDLSQKLNHHKHANLARPNL
jgi:hypothetical protein